MIGPTLYKAYKVKNHIPLADSVRSEDVTSFFFGVELTSSVLYTYVLSASFLVVSILSPILSGIADYSGQKKLFMKIFCYIGAISCCGLSSLMRMQLSLV